MHPAHTLRPRSRPRRARLKETLPILAGPAIPPAAVNAVDPGRLVAMTPADMSVDELCLAWYQGRIAETDAAPGEQRDSVRARRESLLDEIARRRDSRLARWLTGS